LWSVRNFWMETNLYIYIDRDRDQFRGVMALNFKK